MSRLSGACLIGATTLLASLPPVHAETDPAAAHVVPDDIEAAAPAGPTTKAPADMSDQGIGASIGIAGGGRVTPGGMRVVGHYLYQLSESDWFDGTAAFTFGSGAAGCFRDRMNEFLCDHGLVDGFSAEVGANVRRFFGGNGQFWPFARLGVGIAIVRFPDDDVTGLAVPFHLGGGIRASVSDGVAVTVEATLDVGFGGFSQGLGLEPQFGGSVTAGAEFRL